MRLCYDVESNGLVNYELDNKGNMKAIADRIHCIVVQDIDTGKVWQFRPGQHKEAAELISKATVLVGQSRPYSCSLFVRNHSLGRRIIIMNR